MIIIVIYLNSFIIIKLLTIQICCFIVTKVLTKYISPLRQRYQLRDNADMHCLPTCGLYARRTYHTCARVCKQRVHYASHALRKSYRMFTSSSVYYSTRRHTIVVKSFGPVRCPRQGRVFR